MSDGEGQEPPEEEAPKVEVTILEVGGVPVPQPEAKPEPKAPKPKTKPKHYLIAAAMAKENQE